jgi:hypothetical protein
LAGCDLLHSLKPAFSITYRGNGATSGSVPVDSNKYCREHPVRVLGNTGILAKTGFGFAGWNTEADGSGSAKRPGSTFEMGSADLVLYAQWVSCTVKFEANGGSETAPQTGEIAAFPVSTKSGFALEGWYTDPGFARSSKVSFPYLPLSDSTLYAKWIVATQDLDYTAVSDGYEVSKGRANVAGAVTIPAFWLGKPITAIGMNAFKDCAAMTALRIPSSVKSILDAALRSCTALREISLPEGLESIGNEAFYACTSLSALTIPSGVNSIGYSAFEKCSGLMDLTIPSGLTLIRDRTFYDCRALMSLSLPESAISIGVGVFVNCNNLKSLRIPGSITSIERNTFYACWNLTTLTIPSGVTSIGDGAFQNCSGLTRLTIPGKVASIGARAFDNCDSLTELELPQGVVSLGDYAFQNCDRLKTFTSFSLSPPLAGLSLFASCPALARIKVPSASLSAYKTAPGWSSYASCMVSTGVFSLEYNANFASGGSVPVDPNHYKEGDAVTVQGNTASLVRTDCSFGGWNTMPDGTGANYAAGDTVFVEAKDIVLFARWNRNSTWFHIVNSWGVGGGWEHVPDGKYWFTAEAMKNAQVYAFVLENIDDYEPRFVARFAISHPNRGQCLVGMSVGDPSAPVAQRRILPFSPFQGAGSLPLYAADTISVDVTEWASMLATHDLYLSFRIGVTGTPGSLESFVLEEYSGYNSAPVRTLRAEATLPVSVTDASTTLNVRIPSSGILSDMSRSQERAGIVASRFPTRSFSSREVADMKSRIGVRSTSRNYNQIILGHGTGLAPPSEEEWGQIALQGKTIDTSGMTLSRSESPSQRDLSLDAAFPPIGNQGSLGSCAPFSLAYYVKSYQEARERGWDLSDSGWTGVWPGYPARNLGKIMSPKFVYNLINGGKDAGAYYTETVYILNNFGCATWEKFPYGTDYLTWPDTASWKESPLYRGKYPVGNYYFSISTDADIEALCGLVDAGIPVTLSVDANKFQYLTGDDVWDSSTYVNPSTNHANTLVGYRR